MTGAEAVVRALERAGVRVAFGLPGVHNLALWRALRGSPVRLVGVRHEQSAGYAADGFARATGGVGVALVTTGPGAANTLGAVGEAYASRSPVVVIATDIPAALRREGVEGGVLHETRDQAAMFAPVTRAQVVVEGAVGEDVVRDALDAALREQGPVLLQIPTDLLAADAVACGPVLSAGSSASSPEADGASGAPSPGAGPGSGPALGRAPSAALAVDIVRAGERPLLWAGTGAVEAADAVRALAERLGAPVVTTYGARGVVAHDHPLFAGPAHAEPVGRLWDAADLVIAWGSDLDAVDTQNWRQPQPPRLVAINPDPVDAAKNYRVDAVVAGLDARAFPQRAPWADLGAVRAEVRATHDPAARDLLDAFAAAVPEDAVVVVDMCIPGYWLAAFGAVAAPRRLQVPLGWGTLGFGFPAAIGAALAHDGPVVSVNGDGGFLFACGELATVAQERPPLTVVIADDGGYGMLRFDQERAGDAPFGVDLVRPDFVALAQSFGLRTERVGGLGEAFGVALARHVADPEPTVLVAEGPPLPPPPTTSPGWYRTGPPVWAARG